jgi:hypothetical protein
VGRGQLIEVVNLGLRPLGGLALFVAGAAARPEGVTNIGERQFQIYESLVFERTLAL